MLLLDEITVDLDVLGRAELMQFLKEECEQRGATIIYATHIFDGLEFWPSHVAYLARGEMAMFKEVRAWGPRLGVRRAGPCSAGHLTPLFVLIASLTDTTSPPLSGKGHP